MANYVNIFRTLTVERHVSNLQGREKELNVKMFGRVCTRYRNMVSAS
jgi:hypothetical protein